MRRGLAMMYACVRVRVQMFGICSRGCKLASFPAREVTERHSKQIALFFSPHTCTHAALAEAIINIILWNVIYSSGTHPARVAERVAD